MIVRISSALVARLQAEAAVSPDAEVCGLLLGPAGSIEAAVAAMNVADHPGDSFEIDPTTLFAAIRAERRGALPIIGHYHSHPHGPARPSARDAAAAREAGRLWLILGADEVTLWQSVPGGAVEGAFEPVILERNGGSGCAS